MALSLDKRSPAETDPRAWRALLTRLSAEPTEPRPAPDDRLVRPAYRRRVVTRARPLLAIRAKNAGISPDAYAEHAAALLRTILADAVVARRMRPHTLEAFLEVGSIFPAPTVYQLADEVGLLLSPDATSWTRWEREVECFGRHPIYAYLTHDRCLIGDPSLDIYGGDAIVLHRRVLERCTFCVTCAFIGEPHSRLPCRPEGPSVFVYDLNHLSQQPLTRATVAGTPAAPFLRAWRQGICEESQRRHSRNAEVQEQIIGERYMDVHIFGGVDINDVERVVLGHEPDERLLSLLDRRKVPWSVQRLEWLADPIAAMGVRAPRFPCREQLDQLAAQLEADTRRRRTGG